MKQLIAVILASISIPAFAANIHKCVDPVSNQVSYSQFACKKGTTPQKVIAYEILPDPPLPADPPAVTSTEVKKEAAPAEKPAEVKKDETPVAEKSTQSMEVAKTALPKDGPNSWKCVNIRAKLPLAIAASEGCL